jgi:short subunit dehydrogenase-like uncharacterized protein
MNGRDWVLYGANGYTGELIAEEAKRRGLAPILAGRREAAIRPLAERLGFPWRVFGGEGLEPAALRRGLEGAAAVLLCAGPFSKTSGPFVDACLAGGVHYLDITGEVDVFEACAARDAAAKEKRIVVFPGVGFDVVPSDCLALRLKEALPDANVLELAFFGTRSPSKGTAKTAVEGLALGGRARRGGKVVTVPMAEERMRVPFTPGARTVVSVPWGDVSTAYYSTGIPNITVFTVVPRQLIRFLPVLRPVVRVPFLLKLLQSRVDRNVPGPTEEERRTGRSHLWGRVTDPAGRSRTGTLDGPEGYNLTVVTALECMRRVVAAEVPAGFTTPARAFGSGFIETFDGVTLRVD